jgi:N-formylglutamate deformylase
VFSSPHSGSDYAPAFLALSRLELGALRRSEDCHIDQIFAGAPEAGATLLAATFPRAWCDVNREAWELDPAMFEDKLPDWVNAGSARVAAGLGTIARLVSSGEAIYRQRLRFDDASARIATCWQPYHAELTRLLDAARARFGACLLVDCHSMPAHACQDRRPMPDIVLGDAYGAACAPGLLRLVEHFLVRRGYVVRRNDPYAGGYITRHYGKPAEHLHALQIEIARRLYMEESTLAPQAGFRRVQTDMTDLARLLAEQALPLMRGTSQER